MYTILSVEVLVGTFLGLLIAMVVLLVLQIRTTGQVNKLTFPAYEYVIKKAEHDATKIIEAAQAQARTIVTAAEQSGQATIADYTNQATEIHAQYRAAITEQTQSIANTLSHTSATQTDAVRALTDATRGVITAQEEQIRTHTKSSAAAIDALVGTIEHETTTALSTLITRIETIGQTLEATLHDASVVEQAALAAQLTAMQAAADAQVKTYQAARMKLLDVHIDQLVESVVQKVLHTQLPVAEHTSLARAALTEAKTQQIL